MDAVEVWNPNAVSCIVEVKFKWECAGQGYLHLPLFCVLLKKNDMNEETILLTENILDIFRKKNAGMVISDEEIDQVVNRFKELAKAPLV